MDLVHCFHFEKCYVPKKFATWVARLVDSKSGDIVIDGMAISLIKDSIMILFQPKWALGALCRAPGSFTRHATKLEKVIFMSNSSPYLTNLYLLHLDNCF